VDRRVHLIAEPGQRLVDRVVDDFVDQVVQAGRPGRADVHRRALADRLETLEYLDFVCGILRDLGCRAVAIVPAQRSRSRGRRAGRRTIDALSWSGRLFVLVGSFHVVSFDFVQTRIGMIT
jgi:hypothetical protein